MHEVQGSIFEHLFANGLIAFSAISSIGIAFICCYLVFKFFDFSLPASCCVGAYSTLFFTDHGSGLVVGIICGSLLAGFYHLVVASQLYGRLSDRNVNSSGLIIASIAVYLIVINTISMSFGAGIQVLDTASAEISRYPSGIHFSNIQLTLVLFGGGCFLAFFFISVKTRFGRDMRAAYQNSELASIVGINVKSLRYTTAFLAGCIAGFVGILVGIDTGITPAIGFSTYLLAVVSVMVVGPLAKTGLLGASAFMAAASIATIWFVGADFLNAVVFSILVLVLASRAWTRKRQN